MPSDTTKLDPAARNVYSRLLTRLADILDAAADRLDDPPTRRSEIAKLNATIADGLGGILPVESADLTADTSEGARRSVRRTLMLLEKAGLVERLRRGADGVRVTHLRLVEQGNQLCP